MENYLNKDAIIAIAFSGYWAGGNGTIDVYGKITASDNEFVSIEHDPNRKENKLRTKNTSGTMMVNKQYLVSVILL